MQLGLAHGPLESEQQTVVELAGVVEAVLIEYQCVGQRADLEQPVPIRGVAREPRHLETEHNTDLAHAHRGDQLLEALAIAVSSRLAEVRVDDHHAVQWPTQCDCALT